MTLCTICSRQGHAAYACPWRIRAFATAAAVALSVTGCGSTKEPPPPPQVKIIGDTYCAASKPQSWSRNDTTETIHEARQKNAGYDAKCGGKKSGG